MIIKTHQKVLTKQWRKGFLIFATFFCFLFFFSSCKKKKNKIGKSALPSGVLMSSDGVDTFQIKTYTVTTDSVNAMDPEFDLLGSYNDKVFGQVNASFYTQLTLSGFSPDFGSLSKISIDSAVMAFEFGGQYGSLSTQKFEIYEITEDLTRDSSYTRNSVLQTSSQNLVPTGQGLILPRPTTPAIVGEDTLEPQLRIPIDTIFARHLMQLAENSASDEDFLQNFKGLFFKVNNGFQMPGEGSIIYLASAKPASKLTVYYTDESGKQKEFSFIINGEAIDFNHFNVNWTGTKVKQVLDDPSIGQKEYYVQAFTTRAKVEFPTLENLPKNIIIHSATLTLPVSYFPKSDFYPSDVVNVSAKLFPGDNRKYIIGSSSFSPYSKSYVIDLRNYIQKIIEGTIVSKGLYISPKRFNTSAERMIFNGADSPYKKQPQLNIVYTKL